MFKYFLTVVMGFAALLTDSPLVVGDTAPDFVLPDHDGKRHKLSDYRGKRVVVYFFPKADTPG